jgi:hypothetical protein
MSQITITNPDKIFNFYNNFLNQSIINPNILLDSVTAHTPKVLNQIDWKNNVSQITINNHIDHIVIFIKDITNIDTVYKDKPIDLLKIITSNSNNNVKLYNLLEINWQSIAENYK